MASSVMAILPEAAVSFISADDAAAAAWFSRDALPELAFEATHYFLKNF